MKVNFVNNDASACIPTEFILSPDADELEIMIDD